ncbi:cob(I)yrinic acid a,c-diamide adenosyltransferase [Candidatus Uhrbacteria bacterium CG_4_10_14_0_8_um_filter_58_22]|uniref:Cob(I)yrinic acid a,c-diamide adenosyltransferase n=1 Tax=Candidatus Uhrbacteria bacterium CG_4_10_14_0_8_um_filter_58_22 TaxID=1975029 RepID=A0A2M7Q9T7_9BACT|nr:MAG: cob(I)yrinic acid a,c-diamide adenosyltransferase [Candidatus Uhrbacteria bacterium CG_4_10_14_0_8_um_filter_58_22]
MSKSLIQIYTGDGKGKTTAALGLAVRAVGAGKKVAIVYFDKGGDHYSERKVLAERFAGEIDFFATGQDRIAPDSGQFRFGVERLDIDEAARGLELVRELIREARHDLIVLDEINTSASLGLLPAEPVVELLRNKPDSVELVLTGRNAPQSFLDQADLVTEMGLVDHYYRRGVKAREGFDF